MAKVKRGKRSNVSSVDTAHVHLGINSQLLKKAAGLTDPLMTFLYTQEIMLWRFQSPEITWQKFQTEPPESRASAWLSEPKRAAQQRNPREDGPRAFGT